MLTYSVGNASWLLVGVIFSCIRDLALTTMISDTQKLKLLDKVLHSKSFLSSPTSSALLKFLVEATIDGVDIKESTIGLHLYGGKYEGEKSNARIRVSVYHLRKKLEQYYTGEGADDGWQLTIDKGQYGVTFPEVKSTRINARLKWVVHVVYVFVIFVMLLMAGLYLHKPSVPIWESIISSNKETVMYIGDVYGYMGRTPTGGWGWQRDFEVNNEQELENIKTTLNLSDAEIRSANYTYTTASEVDAAKDISRLFFEQDKDFTIRLASKIDVKDLKEQNIIYVGPMKTDNRFVRLLTEHFPQFSYQDEKLLVATDNRTKPIALEEKYRSELQAIAPSEIAIVTKIEGGYNTHQFMFFSDHDMGVRATVDFFSDADSLKQFRNTYLKNRSEFVAVFLVKGNERVDLGMRFLDIHFREYSLQR